MQDANALIVVMLSTAGINQILLDNDNFRALAAEAHKIHDSEDKGRTSRDELGKRGGGENRNGVKLLITPGHGGEEECHSTGAGKLDENGSARDKAVALPPLEVDSVIEEKAGAVVMGLWRLEELLQSLQSDEKAGLGRDATIDSALQQIRDIGGQCKVCECLLWCWTRREGAGYSDSDTGIPCTRHSTLAPKSLSSRTFNNSYLLWQEWPMGKSDRCHLADPWRGQRCSG